MVITDVPDLAPLCEATHAEVTGVGQAVVDAFRTGAIDPRLMDKLANATGVTLASGRDGVNVAGAAELGSRLRKDCTALYDLRHSIDTRIAELVRHVAPNIQRLEWEGYHKLEHNGSYFYIDSAKFVLASGEVVFVPAFEDWEGAADLQVDHERRAGGDPVVLVELDAILDGEDPMVAFAARQLAVLKVDASLLDTILAASEIYARSNPWERCLHFAAV